MNGDPSMNSDGSSRVQHSTPDGHLAGMVAQAQSGKPEEAGSSDRTRNRVPTGEGGLPLLLLLRNLEAERMPWTTTDLEQMGRVRKLLRLDLVAAIFGSHESGVPFARVLAISKLGRSVLVIDGSPRKKKSVG